MSAFMREFTKAARQGPRLFFAPIAGAVHAVRHEMDRMSSSNNDDRAESNVRPRVNATAKHR